MLGLWKPCAKKAKCDQQKARVYNSERRKEKPRKPQFSLHFQFGFGEEEKMRATNERFVLLRNMTDLKSSRYGARNVKILFRCFSSFFWGIWQIALLLALSFVNHKFIEICYLQIASKDFEKKSPNYIKRITRKTSFVNKNFQYGKNASFKIDLLWQHLALNSVKYHDKFHSRPQSPRSFWPVAGIESSGLTRFSEYAKSIRFVFSTNQICQIWREVRESRTSGVGPSQSSRSLPQARKIVLHTVAEPAVRPAFKILVS